MAEPAPDHLHACQPNYAGHASASSIYLDPSDHKICLMPDHMKYPGLTITASREVVKITYGTSIARIRRDIWPPAWNIDALDPEVARGIVSWFEATRQAPRDVFTPIEIVLQMVLRYLNIDAAMPVPRSPEHEGPHRVGAASGQVEPREPAMLCGASSQKS